MGPAPGGTKAGIPVSDVLDIMWSEQLRNWSGKVVFCSTLLHVSECNAKDEGYKISPALDIPEARIVASPHTSSR
jgi:hypothetical protein